MTYWPIRGKLNMSSAAFDGYLLMASPADFQFSWRGGFSPLKTPKFCEPRKEHEEVKQTFCKCCTFHSDSHRPFGTTKEHGIIGKCRHRGYRRDHKARFCFNHFEVCKNGSQHDAHRECHVKYLCNLGRVTRNELHLLDDQAKQLHADIEQTKEWKLNDVKGQREYVLKQNKNFWRRIQLMINQYRRNSKKEVHSFFNEEIKRIGDVTNETVDTLNRFFFSVETVQMHFQKHTKTMDFVDLPGMIVDVEEATRKFHEPVKPFKVPDYLQNLEKHISNVNCEATQQQERDSYLDIYSQSDSLDLETDSGDLDTDLESVLFLRQSLENKKTESSIEQTSAQRIKSLFIKLNSDKVDCCITGLAVCDNGNLLLVDCYNKRIKLSTPNGEIIAFVDIPGEPYDVAVSDKGDAGVAMWMNQKEILLVDVKSSTLKAKGNIKLRNRICSIIAIEDDFVLSCDDKIPSVRRVSRNGDTKWELAFNSDGRKVFKAPGYVVTNTNVSGSHILVSDAETHAIAVVDSKLGTLIKMIPQSKSAPLGLAVDDSNNIFVGCRLSIEIRIWSSTLENNKVVLSKDDELKRPQAIAFNPITGELLVSSWGCNSIERFKIFSF